MLQWRRAARAGTTEKSNGHFKFFSTNHLNRQEMEKASFRRKNEVITDKNTVFMLKFEFS
jgi:hypothetical protein